VVKALDLHVADSELIPASTIMGHCWAKVLPSIWNVLLADIYNKVKMKAVRMTLKLSSFTQASS